MGVHTKAISGFGGKNVQTIKLNKPAMKPIAVPAPGPSRMAAIMTGNMASVATIGPIGMLPRGVKQTMASSARSIANCARNRTLILLGELAVDTGIILSLLFRSFTGTGYSADKLCISTGFFLGLPDTEALKRLLRAARRFP